MRTSQGIFHAAMLALSTMMLPDGAGADDDAMSGARAEVSGVDMDDTDEGESMATDPLDPVLDSCRRQRRLFKQRWREALGAWAPGRVDDLRQRAINYFCVLVLLDADANPLTQYARKEVLNRLCREVPGEEIVAAMTKLELEPGECAVLTSAPELGLPEACAEAEVRRRCSKMVREFLYSLTSDCAI
ncbi:MAG: hypothetical protein KIS92_00180 [Planctomycetota bacterium]|nr:hypothetical protein [Planctomycetota bacterium]